ncbi:MAG: fumarylacetoacetate hydrolase family protein [Bryobacteraceae bacterium]|nr:fumarylacetoacetate hydrolase family protein [Bryobacteraceae bacterium]
MRLGQVLLDGAPVAAIFEGVRAYPLGWTMVELLDRAEAAGMTLAEAAKQTPRGTPVGSIPTIPIAPREVWACGCTYEMSASFRDAEHGTREGFYRYVFQPEHRPEVFFKGTARVCVGPDEPIGIRQDSKFTAPEPELAVVLDSKGRVHGFTVANDVSAWDIERENPLYLPQSKTYAACCALGPVIVTADEIGDPYSLEMTCTIKRGDATIFSGGTSTGKLGRKIETLVEYLMRSNPVPCGTVLLTGTGIIVKEDAALAPGDICEIDVSKIGLLSNVAAVV